MHPGRNEPCPCGSGKKYKHCCLNASTATMDSPAALTWRRVRRTLDGLPAVLLKFTLDTFGPDAIRAAWREFTLDSIEEHTEFDPHTPHMQIFMPWFFHRWVPTPEKPGVTPTPTRAFLERRDSRPDPLLRRYLEACLAAPFSFHEIMRSDPGRGFTTRDVLTGEERDVFEQSASKSMQVGDILYGQLVCVDGIVMLEACAPCPIPPVHKIGLIDLRRKLIRASGLSGDELLRDCEFELRDIYFELTHQVLNPPPPQLQNTDGDPLELQRLIFDVESAQVAFDALAHLALKMTAEELLKEAKRDSSGALRAVQFDWMKAGNRMHASWSNTVLGNIEIDGTRLVAQVNSAKRAKTFRDIVTRKLGKRARYRATEIQSIEKMLAEQRMAGGTSRASLEHEELAALPEVRGKLGEMMAAHFESWVTMRLPALGDKTPLETVRTAAGREKVAALLVDAERHARAMNPPVDESVLVKLRERLGLADK